MSNVQNALQLAFQSLTKPRQVLRFWLDQDHTLVQIVQAGALMLAIGVFLNQLARLLFADPEQEALLWALNNPFLMLGLQLGIMLLTAFLMAKVGALFGGKGDFRQAMVAMVWLQFLLLLLNVAQLVFAIVLPVLAIGVFLYSAAIVLVFLVASTMEIHNFESIPAVCIGILLTFIATAFVIGLILTMLGVTPPEGFQNV